MKHRILGKTGLRVSEVGFGAWAIGGTSYGPTRDEDSLDALEAAWESGVNFFDTADTYGHGHSETLLSRFLKNKPRHQTIIASKVGWDFYHGASRKNFDLTYVRFALEQSLKRLELETIDLYQLHNPSIELIKRGELVGLLEEFKREGKIRFIGTSIHSKDEAFAAMEDPRVDTLQLVFNLLDQRMAEEVFPEAQAKNIGLIVREPLAFGMLTGKYTADHEFHKIDHRRRFMREQLENDLKKIEAVKGVLSTKHLPLVRAALEFILNFYSLSTVIPGAKSRAQVLENVQASNDPKLRMEELRRLRELYLKEPIFREILKFKIM